MNAAGENSFIRRTELCSIELGIVAMCAFLKNVFAVTNWS